MRDRLFRLPPAPWIVPPALLLLAGLVYLPSLHGPLVFDDKVWTTDLEWAFKNMEGLRQLWFAPRTAQQYYPLTATTFWIDYQLWGFNTLPYHVENVLLHGLAGVLFWLVLRQLGIGGAFFAAALFVAHPVMVESVAWIAERKNALSQVFFLAALLAYGRSVHGWRIGIGDRSWSWWALAFLFFVAAVLSKITAVVFPAVVLVIVWWKRRRLEWRRDILPLLPMFLVSLVSGLGIAWLETHNLGAEGGDFKIPVSGRVALAGQTLWFYIGKLLWPHPVCVIYHRWELDPARGWQWLGVAASILVAALLLRQASRGRWRGLAAGAVLFTGTLFPVLGFMNVYGMRYAWVADRWVYLPALVFFAGLGYVWSVLPARFHAWRVALAVALVTACGVLTWRQAATYRSVDAFWQAAIAGNPEPWKARSDYGDALRIAGRPDEAAAQLRMAIRDHPDFADAYCNLGVVLDQMGKPEEALAAFDRAVELEPGLAVVHYNIGRIRGAQGRLDEMEKHLRRAIEVQPLFLTAHHDLGNLLFKTGRLDEAEQHYRRVLALRPGNAYALTSLGNVFYWKGLHPEAADFFRRALDVDPDLVPALAKYGQLLASTQDDTLRDVPRAVQLAGRAVQLSGQKDPVILSILAAALASAGRFPEAAEAAGKGAGIAETLGNSDLASRLRQAADAYAAGRLPP